MISWQPRWAPILVVVALAAFAIVAVRSLREPVLRAAGWALVVNEPVASADIIVVSLDSGGAGAFEAADLVQRGISKRVAVFMDPPSGEMGFQLICAALTKSMAALMDVFNRRISFSKAPTAGSQTWIDEVDLEQERIAEIYEEHRRNRSGT